MRTAEQFFNENKRLIDSGYWVNEVDFKNAIREAQIEAIKECAKSAKAKPMNFSKEQIRLKEVPAKVVCAIDYQSILKLIEQVK
jgi:hypothetical protein